MVTGVHLWNAVELKQKLKSLVAGQSAFSIERRLEAKAELTKPSLAMFRMTSCKRSMCCVLYEFKI